MISHQPLEKTAPLAHQGLLLVDQCVVDKITAKTKLTNHRIEIGGLFLGFRRGSHLHVRLATMPSRGDASERFRFVRRDITHQIIAYRSWLASGFRSDWIGEWHTHPEVNPRPSSVDLETWRKQVSRLGKKMAYLIVGTTSTWVGVVAPGSLEFCEMRLVESRPGTKLFAAKTGGE